MPLRVIAPRLPFGGNMPPESALVSAIARIVP